MSSTVKNNVDYRLLNNLSNLVVCSACLRFGRVTPVPQIITKRRTPTNLCANCRAEQTPKGLRRQLGKLLHFPA